MYMTGKFLFIFLSAKTFAGLNGTVTGWGATAESGAISQTLQEVTVPILSNADCRASKYPSQRITDNMLCAGYKEGSKDSCQVINNKFFFSVIVTINTSPLLTTYTNGNCYVFVHLHLLCVYHLIYTWFTRPVFFFFLSLFFVSYREKCYLNLWNFFFCFFFSLGRQWWSPACRQRGYVSNSR